MTDRAIDLMQDVQNLRKAIYELRIFHFLSLEPWVLTSIISYKLKCETCEKNSSKQRKLMNIAVNYLFAFFPSLIFVNGD